jgi:hypothetical protein
MTLSTASTLLIVYKSLAHSSVKTSSSILAVEFLRVLHLCNSPPRPLCKHLCRHSTLLLLQGQPPFSLKQVHDIQWSMIHVLICHQPQSGRLVIQRLRVTKTRSHRKPKTENKLSLKKEEAKAPAPLTVELFLDDTIGYSAYQAIGHTQVMGREDKMKKYIAEWDMSWGRLQKKQSI